jgi:hypothetical protein
VHLTGVCLKSKVSWLIFLIEIVGRGGVESNWVHSTLRPPICLLYHSRMIMMMENLVEWWSTGETEVLWEILPQCRFICSASEK